MNDIIRPILSTYRAYVNMTRLRRIVSVLFRNGLGMFFDHFAELVPMKLRRRPDIETKSLAERVRMTLVELGPTFVKLGQMLSIRPDTVGDEFAAELSKLQDQVPPFPFSEVKSVIERELGAPLTELFKSFEEEPSAAASMAQGHRAVLPDGTAVFVKVCRPGIHKSVKTDLDILNYLAAYAHENYPELRYLMLPRVIEQFRAALLEELDFNNERGNMKHFARQFAKNEDLVVPAVYDRWCSSQVLTMEFIDGIKADNVEELRAKGYDLKRLAEIGSRISLEEYFTFGFFHADPHPGNIFVLPGHKLAYIDFGLCGRVTSEERELFCRTLLSVIDRDERRATQMLLKLTVYEQEPDCDELECALGEFIDRNFYGSLRDLDVPGAIRQIYEICNRFKIALRPHVYLLLKSVGMSDNLGRLWDPDYDLESHLKPFVTAGIIPKPENVKAVLHSLLADALNFKGDISHIPGAIRRFWNELMAGRLHFRLGLDDCEKFIRSYNHGQNRRAVATISAGAMLSSALLLAAKFPPLWGEVSIVGAAGLLFSGILAAAIAIDIIRFDK